MLDTTLPLHAVTGIQALGWRKPRPSAGEVDPQPIWPILGGDGTGDDGRDDDSRDDSGDTQDQDQDDSQDDDRDGDAQDDDTDASLGEKGKKALRELRRENRQLKAQLRTKPAATDGKPKTAKKDDDGAIDADAIREQARQEAQAEVWNDRVEAAAVAAAAGRLANPQLAARLLDLSDIPENDKGRPDRAAITELIDELLEDEPYLAAKSATDDTGRRFKGGADAGARKPAKKAAANLGEAIAAKLAGTSG
jgi:hypothetical protein